LDPKLDPTLLLTAFAAALAGSAHCAAMCGPLRLFVTEHPHGRFLYQLGRALSYVTCGVVAGAAGLTLPPWISLPLLLLAALFIAFPKVTNGLRLPGQRRIMALAASNPLFLGASSALLPCGLLHAWIAAAAATRSPLGGGAILACLWLGSAPALECAPSLLRSWLPKARARFPRALPLFLLALALAPVAWRLGAPSSSPEACPMHSHQQHHAQ
jgi:uncharacterized protein